MTENALQNIEQIESSLWEAADQLRANSKLTSSEYCMPVLGVIFLRHATNRYYAAKAAIEADQAAGKMPKRPLVKADFVKRRAMMLPQEGQFDELLKLPKGANLGAGPGRGHERHRGRVRAARSASSPRTTTASTPTCSKTCCASSTARRCAPPRATCSGASTSTS